MYLLILHTDTKPECENHPFWKIVLCFKYDLQFTKFVKEESRNKGSGECGNCQYFDLKKLEKQGWMRHLILVRVKLPGAALGKCKTKWRKSISLLFQLKDQQSFSFLKIFYTYSDMAEK